MLGGINIVNNKFKDINEIYNTIKITDECIVTKENNSYSKVYIYEIKPIILLDLSENVKEKIVLEYKEFLRQINFNFQILVINKEVKFGDYMNQILNSNVCDNKIYNEYIKDMEIKFKNENIFDTIFYIIVKFEDKEYLKVENVDNSLKILEKTGCKIKKISNKENLEKILNSSINKEW